MYQLSSSTCICGIISHLIRYSRACGSVHDFLDRWLLLTRRLPNQDFLVININIDIKFSAHDAFLEQPSPDTVEYISYNIYII
jgi:hypothetical protein